MPNTPSSSPNAEIGARVRTWDGHAGVIVDVQPDGWLELQLDGETRRDLWPPAAVEVLS